MKRLFLHLPKCAGSSVLQMLEDAIPDQLEKDYDSYFGIPAPQRRQFILDALLRPAAIPAGKVVYGHFFPVKYLGAGKAKDIRMVTILRDPIERLRSHYSYWRATDQAGNYLWRKMVESQWSFEQFAFSEEMRNYYAQYFAQTTLASFAFIGLYEHLEYSVWRCFDELDIPMPDQGQVPKVNVTRSAISTELDGELLRKLREHHWQDYVIYDYARQRFHSDSQAAELC